MDKKLKERIRQLERDDFLTQKLLHEIFENWRKVEKEIKNIKLDIEKKR